MYVCIYMYFILVTSQRLGRLQHRCSCEGFRGQTKQKGEWLQTQCYTSELLLGRNKEC